MFWGMFLLAGLLVPSLSASENTQRPAAAATYKHSWSIPDLDGDAQPELARQSQLGWDRRGYAHAVDFQMSADGGTRSIQVHTATPSALGITFRDIDGDNDLDVIIHSGLSHQPIALWINDSGEFTPASLGLISTSQWSKELSLEESGPSRARPPTMSLCRTVPPSILAAAEFSHALVPSNGAHSARTEPVVTRSYSSSAPRAPPART